MLTGIVRFADDAAGIEKTLRFAQYMSQTIAAILVASPKRAQPYSNVWLETARGTSSKLDLQCSTADIYLN